MVCGGTSEQQQQLRMQMSADLNIFLLLHTNMDIITPGARRRTVESIYLEER